MSKHILINIFRFILLVLLQIGILNNINLFGYINPQLYILAILLFPFEIPGWFLLLLGFAAGFCIDIFSGVIGLHTAAMVFIAFIREKVIQLVGEKPEYESNFQPNIHDMGIKWFVTYATILVFAHQLFLNLMEAFSFYQFGQTLLRTILSSIFTLVLIIVGQYIFRRQKA